MDGSDGASFDAPEMTAEQQARLLRISELASRLCNEITSLEEENMREAARIYRLADPNDMRHPAVRRLKATENATYHARSSLQAGLMWLRRAATQTERF